MPDYASILRRSVAALPDPTAEMREAVYQRARAALARQLTAVDPPLSTREIENQHQELEDAVVRLEAEFAPAEERTGTFGGGTAHRKDDFLYSAPQAPPPPAERRPHPQPVSDFQERERQRTAAEPAYEEDEEEFEEEDRRSRIPLIAALVAIVLVIVGAGAYVYSQRDALMSFIASAGSSGDDTAAVGPVREPAASADDPDKRTDRLTNGTEPPPASDPAAETDLATVPPPAAAPPPAPSPAPAADSTSPAPSDAEQLDNLASMQGQTSTSLEEPATSLVEQRAIYYFQGADGQAGQASEGTATWAEITKDNHPAIQATINIPERKVLVTVTIYKNYDNELPASHLVEVQFTGTLSQSAILRVPALVLKQTEQARGQPLAGAAVPVTNELFWIALSSENDESARNVQLLREGSWFDIPILFNDQTRALITFEKGIPGDKVFETVMASWTPA